MKHLRADAYILTYYKLVFRDSHRDSYLILSIQGNFAYRYKCTHFHDDQLQMQMAHIDINVINQDYVASDNNYMNPAPTFPLFLHGIRNEYISRNEYIIYK